MSELTRCNHCNLVDLYRRHGKDHVTLEADPDMPEWTRVKVDGETVSHMMQITPHCCC